MNLLALCLSWNFILRVRCKAALLSKMDYQNLTPGGMAFLLRKEFVSTILSQIATTDLLAETPVHLNAQHYILSVFSKAALELHDGGKMISQLSETWSCL